MKPVFHKKTLEDLLNWGRDLHCKDNEELKSLWPSCWNDVTFFLEKFGYKHPKLFWICLDDSHPCLFSIMAKKSDRCPHCDNEGSIPYYYMSLIEKVRRWCSSPSLCRSMTAHWKERNHWLPPERKDGWGWSPKKEFWDGTRFAELAYFWDPNSEWILPLRCPENDCTAIISADTLLSSPELEGGRRQVECPDCLHTFECTPQITRGDPRNLAYDGE